MRRFSALKIGPAEEKLVKSFVIQIETVPLNFIMNMYICKSSHLIFFNFIKLYFNRPGLIS